MMLVKTYVSPSKIHGLGIFAQEYISKGTIIWRYIEGFDRRYTQDEINKLPKQAKEYIGTYGWRSAKSGLICIGLDNDKYFNHSETPNSLSEYRDNEIEVITIAVRDINPNEEITDNYLSFEPDLKDMYIK